MKAKLKVTVEPNYEDESFSILIEDIPFIFEDMKSELFFQAWLSNKFTEAIVGYTEKFNLELFGDNECPFRGTENE